jgi:hypothetical protein
MASPTDWSRVIGTTIVNHLREEELATFRKFKIFSLLENSGNVVMNQSGRGMDWNVRFRNAPVTGNTGDTPRTFSRVNMWKRAELPWRGFTTTDAIYRREMLENRGQQALVDVASKMAERLKESLEQHLSYQPYGDGNASGKENDFHGLESFLGYSGTIDEANAAVANQNSTSATVSGVVYTGGTADRYGFPSDNYAGLETKLGYYGGGRLTTSTGVWPNVPVDPEFDYYSPLVINYNASSFNNLASGNRNWKVNCVYAMREGIQGCKRNDTKEAQIDLVVLDRQLYIQFLNTYKEQERIVVSKETGLKALGFADTVSLDGVEITSEYACPAGRGYGISVGNMELRCLENQLMVAEGPFFSEETQAYRYACSTLGNFRFRSPRNFFTLAPITAQA